MKKKQILIIGGWLLVIVLVVVIGLSLNNKKNSNDEVKKVNTLLEKSSVIEGGVSKDKRVEIKLDNEKIDVTSKVKVWLFSNPVYLGEFNLIKKDNGYYELDDISIILKSKNVAAGNHKLLILKDNETLGYVDIKVDSSSNLETTLESNTEDKSANKTTFEQTGSDEALTDKETSSDNNDYKVNNTDKNENKNNVNNENNSNDINTNENKTSTKKLEVEEDIKYTTEEIKETNMLKGKKETIVKGIIGKKKITYNVTYDKNNKEIKREKVSETVVSEPVNGQVKVGISDYNLNDKPTYGLETGLFCLEDEASGFDYKQCDDENLANKNNYYQTISVGNKQYLICMDSSICSDYYDYQFKLSSHPVVSKYKDIYTVTMNGTKYYLDSRAGSDGRELNEEICTELGLVCNRWQGL